jgi:hypothetical protein
LNNDAVQQAAANARGAIDTMIALLQARAQTFENAVAAALPEDEGTNFPAVVVSASRTAKAAPGMEKAVVDFLVLKAWPGDMMSPQQKAAAGRAMFDLAAQIGRLAPLLPPTDPQNPLLVRRDDLVAIARSVIPAIGVAGAHGEVVAVKTAATSLGNLFPRTGALNPLAIGAALQDLQAAMTDGKMLADKSAAGGGGGSKTRSEAIEGKREE